MVYGLTPTGFVPKTLDVLVSEMGARFQDLFNLTPSQTNGIVTRFIDIVGERAAELWELAEVVVSSQDRDKATAAALDALLLLQGSFRLDAIPSSVTLTLTGTPTTVVPSSSRASVTSNGKNFVVQQDGTIASVPAWTVSNAYALEDRVTNSTRVYHCITAGTSAGSGGPTTTDPDITDGTVHWRYLGEGTGAVDAEAKAAETGAIVAVSGEITVIETAVGGWQSVINLQDADLGYDTQTDEAFRITSEEEQSQFGAGTADAIRAEIRRVPGVTSVTVFANTTDTTDGDGLPGHSVEALVRGGDDALIAAALLKQVAAADATYGNVSSVATDSEGVNHTMSFSRPVEINIGVKITLVKDPSKYPADGDDQVKDAIVTYGDAQSTGRDAVSSAILAQAFKVAGVLDVTSCLLSSVAAPGTPATPTLPNTITIATRQLAVYDTSWITVITSNGTP